MGFGINASDIADIKTVVDAIQAKTDNLPSDPSSEATVTLVGGVCAAIQAKTDDLPADPASESGAIKTDTSAILTSVPRVQPFIDCWSDQVDLITVPGTAADLVFPSVTIPVGAIPSGATITRVVAILKVRAIEDDSASDNYIDASGKSIRVIKSGNTWGVDDIVAIDFTINQWYTTASTKENGDVMIGDNDLSSVVDGAGTYDFVSAETVTYGSRADAISALADSLELYDILMGLRVYFTV